MMPPKKAVPKKAVPKGEELPVLISLTMHQVRQGAWVVLEIETQGQEVIGSEVLTSGRVSRTEAENALRVAVARRFLYGD